MAGQLHQCVDPVTELLCDEALGELARTITRDGPAMGGNNLIILLVGGLMVMLIIAALAITIGKIRRQRDEFAEGEDIFDQRFDTGTFENGFADEDDGFSGNERFASVDIQTEEEEFPQPPLEAPTLDPEPPAPLLQQVPRENVVPLPTREERDEREVPQAVPPQEEPMRRDAAMQMAANNTSGPVGDSASDYDYGASAGARDDNYGDRGGADWTRGYEEPRASSGQSYDDGEAPFVAPFIRDYIEEAERRQSSRMDDLRDDMRRQLVGVREEQSSRLDMVLNSIDRKLGSDNQHRANVEENASTRRRIDSLQGTIDSMSQALERQGERVTAFSRTMEERLAEMGPIRGELRDVHEDVLSFRRDVEANTLAISQLRDDFDLMKEDFTRLERSFLDRAQADQGITMRLADVVRCTLDDDEFKLNARLSNGHTADALIMLGNGRSCVAIDSRFPIETFNALPSRDAVRRNLKHAKTGEDEFRRQVLRSIFTCGERCIVDGETTDSAILFMPSEAAYTILHDRFPDLVRDAHRARVWLTSPSTLMGTLALLHNVFEKEEQYEDLPPRASYRDDEGPFYAGPEDELDERDYDRRYEDDRYEERYDDRYDARDEEADAAARLEERLRILREEEQALADELARKREARRRPAREQREPSTAPGRRYKSAPPRREKPEDDFEARLERFSYDLDDGSEYTMDDGPVQSFRRDRDDDLR
ncbi:MAG: DNA recombination protein RmuC [Pseudomonadota bacterium]